MTDDIVAQPAFVLADLVAASWQFLTQPEAWLVVNAVACLVALLWTLRERPTHRLSEENGEVR